MYVELKDINKNFGDFEAAKNINIGIKKGSLVALLGSSGSGKTTILRMIAGLETPTSGDIFIDQKRVNDTPPADRGIGFVFQNYALFRYMTVKKNIEFGLEIKKWPKQRIRERVAELIELVGLKGFENRYPNQLSGGQRQRVAFARALAPEPNLLLLDEPFAAIDAKVRQELRSWLREMIYKVGVTSIFVTHDQEEAVEVADRIIVMNEGVIEQTGSPTDIYKTPDTPFVAEFIGQSTLVDDYGQLEGFCADGEYRQAIIRPEFVEAFKDDSVLYGDLKKYSQKGVVTEIQFRGNALNVTLDVNGIKVITHRSLERRPIAVGEEMNVIIYRVFAIDPDTNSITVKRNESFERDHEGEKTSGHAVIDA